MHATNKNEHQDVIRIVASSEKSFDDAVRSGLNQLVNGPHHKNLRFTNFNVVNLQGTVNHTDDSCEPELFQVVMDVAGNHVH